MASIRTAVIGIGNMGTAHARTIFDGRIKGMELTAVCDINPQRLKECETLFPGIRYFPDALSLAESGVADAVIVAVPHPLHGEIGSLCLSHGLHTLV